MLLWCSSCIISYIDHGLDWVTKVISMHLEKEATHADSFLMADKSIVYSRIIALHWLLNNIPSWQKHWLTQCWPYSSFFTNGSAAHIKQHLQPERAIQRTVNLRRTRMKNTWISSNAFRITTKVAGNFAGWQYIIYLYLYG